MTVKKLSDADKQEILKLYRETGETTSTLAERYDVSNSTISRFLKITLPEDEYETLIAAKRAARTPGGEAKQALLLSQPEPDIAVTQLLVEKIEEETGEENSESTPAFKRVRRRSSAVYEPKPVEKTPSIIATQLQLLQTNDEIVDTPDDDFVDTVKAIAPPAAVEEKVEEKKIVLQPKRLETSAPVVTNNFTAFDKEAQAQEANTIAAILGEELLDESEDLSDDDDLEDLEDLGEDDDVQEMPVLTKRVRSATLIQVLPLSAAPLPKTCYLVIDRASELITRPLKDFGELGQIPTGEIQQKTLPVFDNHRVARRFSTKRDRVIKVPDSAMLQKTRSQLQAKGITRLLVDGQVYSLAPT